MVSVKENDAQSQSGDGTTDPQWWKRINPHSQYNEHDARHQAPWMSPNRDWRLTASTSPLVDKLYEDIREGFSVQQVADLAEKGDALIAEQGSLYQAICGVQHKRMKSLEPQKLFVEQHEHLFPHLVEQLTPVLHMGVLAHYDGGGAKKTSYPVAALSGE